MSETKQKNGYMFGLKDTLGYDKVFTVEPLGLSGGWAVFWKGCYKVEVLFSDKRIIDLRIELGSLLFYLSCVYGDPVREMRQLVWDKLISIGLTRDSPWLLIGDFNELMNNNEKLGGALRNDSTFWDFRNMAENCKIKEVRSSGIQLSWTGWRDRVWVLCRLDRSFGNDEWFQHFPRSSLKYMDMWASDHRLILLSFLLEEASTGKGRFYFDKRMIGKEGTGEAVSKAWSGSGDDISLLDRLAGCRRELSHWKRVNNFNSKNRIQKLQEELEKEIARLHPSARSMSRLRTALALAHKEEERYWWQKSREQWLKEGDKNTSYLHNVVKGKKVRNRVL